MNIKKHWDELAPKSGFASLRLVTQQEEYISCRRGISQPPVRNLSRGAMITVFQGHGYGYAATTDLTKSGLKAALTQAQNWAQFSNGRMVENFNNHVLTKLDLQTRDANNASPFSNRTQKDYIHKPKRPWQSASLDELMEITKTACQYLKTSDDVSHWDSTLYHRKVEQRLITNYGDDIHSEFEITSPEAMVIVSKDGVSSTRTLFANGLISQGGLEIIDEHAYLDQMHRLSEEAHQLVSAPMCPEETLDLLIHPDQMVLQVHESVGHPLELDRILGDERNYAGTSFVTLDMVGNYQYGSPLLNITFDPTDPTQLASYGIDDDGLPAEKKYLIENGILKSLIGGEYSAARAQAEAVACSRACSWNRAPIDRMANINLESGDAELNDMIASVERGLYVKSNCSWSIDDSRNKFQFGCEWGQLIENGKLTTLVRNPNYRGISASFWRNLKMVGNEASTMKISTQYCGKGEPNQAVTVSHKTPHALFSDVDVFGGDA